MVTIIEQTYSLNITPRLGVQGEPLIQVENLDPMTGQAFAEWLLAASRSAEPSLRPASRNSREVWRDTKESPQPKERLKEMDEYNLQWKKFKKKYPAKSNEELSSMTQEWLDTKRNFLANWADQFAADLLGGKI